MRARFHDAIALLKTGEIEKVGEALAILQNTVYAFSMKVCGHREDAEDTMQEVLLRSLPHLSKIGDPREMAAWLYTVTRNRCWRSRRKPAGATTAALSLDELMPEREELQHLLKDRSAGPEDRALLGESSHLLHKAVLSLPTPYRLVLVLHDMEELDTDLVARILGLQPGTVRVRLHRARLAVRKAMAQMLKDGSRDQLALQSKRAVGRDRETAKKGSGRRDPHCRLIFANLSEYLDGRIDAPGCDQIKQHMESCPACMAFLADLSAAIDRCRSFETADCGPVQARLGSLMAEEYLRVARSQTVAAH